MEQHTAVNISDSDDSLKRPLKMSKSDQNLYGNFFLIFFLLVMTGPVLIRYSLFIPVIVIVFLGELWYLYKSDKTKEAEYTPEQINK